MFVIAFIAGLIAVAIFLSNCLPPWQVWLALGLIIAGVIGLSFMPYYKRYKSRLTPPINKAELINAIAEAKMAIDEYVEFIKDLQQIDTSGNKDIRKETAVKIEGKYKTILSEYKKALNSFEKEILKAGTDYEVFVKPLLMLMNMAPLHQFGKWQSAGHDANYQYILDTYVKETIKKINAVSQ